jgi:hypothetical protein
MRRADRAERVVLLGHRDSEDPNHLAAETGHEHAAVMGHNPLDVGAGGPDQRARALGIGGCSGGEPGHEYGRGLADGAGEPGGGTAVRRHRRRVDRAVG